MKKTLVIIAALIMLLYTGSFAENLIYNPAFDFKDGSALPDGWQTDSWDSFASDFAVASDADGNSLLYICSYEANDARWIQDIEVEPGKSYLLSCRVLANGCSTDGKGANISVMNSSATSLSVYDTNGNWEYLDLYGTAGSDQHYITVALRLGGYSATSSGEVWFKDVEVTQLSDDTRYAVSFATYEPVDYRSFEADENETELPERKTEEWTLYTFIMGLAFTAVYTAVKRRNAEAVKTEKKRSVTFENIAALAVLNVLALAVRLYVAREVYGYAVDINCFLGWSESMAKQGFKFYADTGFHDYPPVYMLLLGGISYIRQLLGITPYSTGHVVLVKLLPIISDLVTAQFVYAFSRKRLGHTGSLLLAALILFNPAYIIDTSAWGQADSLLTLLLIITVFLGIKGRWEFALPVFAIAMLTKPQALMFGPVGLVMVIVDCVRNRKQIKRACIGLLAAFALIYLICFPFATNVRTWIIQTAGLDELDSTYVWLMNGGQRSWWREFVVYPYKWIIDLMFGTAGSYPYYALNACNLYTLLGMNKHLMETGFWSVFSYVMLALACVYASFLCVAARKREALPLAGTVLIALIYSFAPMMHERYLFPAIGLGILAYSALRDRRILPYCILTTLTQFLNIYLVLRWGTIFEFRDYGFLQESEHVLNAAVSALNVAGSLYITVIAFDILVLKHVKPFEYESAQAALTNKNRWLRRDYRLNITRLEALAVTLVTLAYGVLAFTNLGTTASPQNAWTSSAYGEQVVFDLGEVKTYRFTYFCGITNTKFTVALSNDGENWTEEAYADVEYASMYSWHWFVPKTRDGSVMYDSALDSEVSIDYDMPQLRYASTISTYPLQTSRYLRLTSQGRGLIINEAAFIDIYSNSPYSITSVYGSAENTAYSALCNEQDTVALTPSYYNGMYFDEIYHARTAYELLHGYPSEDILEWSHPHLGKLFIALGIKAFGMTPFGWRFSGTLFGVLMLPLFYLFIKQLTGNSRLSLLGTLLLALDSMHFTQTRIATIDTYPVFFIIAMYLFMIRYAYMAPRSIKLTRKLVPLGLSGICMGLAWASKWTGIYASAGLAIILFISLGKRVYEHIKLKRAQDEGVSSGNFVREIVITLAFCVVMFILVPLLIYYFSYYWHFRSNPDGLTLRKVWQLQQDMYSYHSRLVDSHFFKSPWYEWPLIVKPMWYYSADKAYGLNGMVSSISCMGNPAVWWIGLVMLIIMLIMLVTLKHPDKSLLITAIGFASQFLPWVLVPRSTFIYHYFASVPFIITATVIVIGMLASRGREYKIGAYAFAGALVCAALILFIMFYPLESGYPCTYEYALKLRWFDWYNFALQ